MLRCLWLSNVKHCQIKYVFSFFFKELHTWTLPFLELFPVCSGSLSSWTGGCVCPFDPCPNPSEDAWLWLWAGMGLWTRFPSLPALISLSPIRSMHERLLCGSFLELGLLDPADPGRPRRGEDLDIFPAGLSRALVRYSRVSLGPSFPSSSFLLCVLLLLLISPPPAAAALLSVPFCFLLASLLSLISSSYVLRSIEELFCIFQVLSSNW